MANNTIIIFIQVQAFGMDITKEEGGQIKIAPHESSTSTPQSSIEETGESTPDEGTGEEGIRAEAGDGEAPVTLADLLGYVYRICITIHKSELKIYSNV